LAASFGFDFRSGGDRFVGTHLCRGTVLDVSRQFDQCHQLEVYSQLQYRSAGAFDTAGLDLLYDLCRVEEV
jgi:hypothetical protein